MIRLLFCCFVITLWFKSISKVLLLITSNVSRSVSTDGADSMLPAEHWPCCLFNWLFDDSFPSSFLFGCISQCYLCFSLCSLFFLFFFLWLLRFCVFSPLNHSTFYSDSSLDLHSVDLQSCSQDLSNFSINSFKWCSAT